MKMRHVVPLLALALSACATSAPRDPAPSPDVAPLFAQFWDEYLTLYPLQATFVGDARFNDRLPNGLTDAYRARERDFNTRWLARIRSVDTAGLSAQDRLSVDIFVRAREEELQRLEYPEHLIPLNQFYSFANIFAQLGSGTSAQPFATVADYDAWLVRMARLPGLFDQAIVNMREGAGKDLVQPRALIDKVLPQLDALIHDDPQQTLFWQPVANMPDTIPPTDRERLQAAYAEAIDTQVMPAYRRLRDFVRDEVDARDLVEADAMDLLRRQVRGGVATHVVGVPVLAAWQIAHAVRFARLRQMLVAHEVAQAPVCRHHLRVNRLGVGGLQSLAIVRRDRVGVRRYTTTDLTPEQIHRIGLDEVARIHGEMRRVIAELGFDDDLQAFFTFLTTDPQFQFDSEEDLLARYNALRERVEAGAAKLFSMTPKAPFEIRPVEAFRARSAAGGSYMRPSEDGSRPGVFYVNTYDLPSRKTWDMEDLFLHEAIPGHHFQLALQQELDGIPAFRRFGSFTAYIEGWGLYAESLGKELGVYTDPYMYFGYLQNELWRAIRLVVDTGLHAKGWTREQVIDYMLANSAESETQAIAEAERYMAIPGQATAYKIGELRIKALRAKAEDALGDDFDIRAFHAEVLKDGAVPLDVLEAKIERWIAAQAR